MNIKTLFLIGVCLLFVTPFSYSQCNTSTAASCMCETPGSIDCDLLPDIICAEPPLLVSGSGGIIEYSQSGNGTNDGRLRISVSTPNIGHGPLEVRTTNQYICGTDTITGTAPATCPITGLPPKQLLIQRVYHKNDSAMSYYDRAAGSMTYHPSHGHMHVDDWGVFTLREATSNPDPTTWPIIGNGAKLAFCLMDYGSCNTYNGHCVDSLGNTLLSGDFPNYGLGGASYSCSAVVQGISSGFTDIYYQSLDGMWIDIPPGTCNGNYQIVVELDPHNYFIEENEDNNVLTVPYTLTNQETLPQANITSSDGNGILCLGSSITLETPAAPSYTYLWNTGATTQTINVAAEGSYIVTVTSLCGVNTSSPFVVNQIGVAPVTSDENICVSGSGNLTAAGNGQLTWYDSEVGGNVLGTGTSYTTPVLNTTTTYYVENSDSVSSVTEQCGPSDNSVGAGGYYTGSQSLTFDALSQFTLESFKLYAQNAGDVLIELRNSGGILTDSITVAVTTGESRVNLNWVIPAGSDYSITRSGSFSLYRSSGGVNYPYEVPGYLSITGSTAGAGFYYFFYDWDIITPGYVCISQRSASTLNVRPLPKASISASGPLTFCRGDQVTLSAYNSAGYGFQWKKYGNSIGGASLSSLIAKGNGKYRCTVTSPYGCVRVSNKIQVNVLPLPVASITANGPTDFCDGDSVTFNANVIPGNTYQWKKYSNAIPGANSTSYTAKKAGKYKVVITDPNGCARGSNSNNVNITCRISDTPTTNKAFNIFPNPASGTVNVEYSTPIKGLMDVEVMNLTGQIVYSKQVFSEEGVNRIDIDISSVKTGMYIIQLHSDENRYRAPLIIE